MKQVYQMPKASLIALEETDIIRTSLQFAEQGEGEIIDFGDFIL